MPRVNGQLLRTARRQRGETVNTVAADVGVAGGTIKNIETGRYPASEDLIDRLAARYGIAVEDLTTTSDDAPLTVMPLGHRISYNIPDAAAMIGVKPFTIREAIRSGELPAAFVGQGYIIPRSELEAYVTRLVSEAATERESA